MTASHDMGGTSPGSVTVVGEWSDAVREMVMNGNQAELAILGGAGLAGHMAAGGAIDPTATTEPGAPREIGIALTEGEIRICDSSSSGGIPGTQADALMMMASTGMRIVRSTKPNCPQGTNLACMRVPEEIVDAGPHRGGEQ